MFLNYLYKINQNYLEEQNNLKKIKHNKIEIQKQSLMNHSISNEIKLYSLKKPYLNIFNLLMKREKYRSFGVKEKTSINQTLTPNICKGKEMAQYRSQIFCGKFGNDGEIYITACQDRKIRIYNTNNFKLLKQINARDVGWSIIDIDLSIDQKWLIYSSWSDYIHICNIQGEPEVHQALKFLHNTNRFCLFSIKFSPKKFEILCGSSNGHIYLYDIVKNMINFKIEAHNDDINSVCYAELDNENIFFSGSDDYLCKIWDKRLLDSSNRKCTGVLRGHFEGITHINTKGDGKYFISNSKDQSIKLWDIRKMKNYFHNSSNLPEYYYNGISKKHLGKRDCVDDQSLMTYVGHQIFETLIRCYFSPKLTTNQKYIYTGSYDSSVYIYDILTGDIISKLNGHIATVRDVDWHPYTPLISSTSWDGSVRFYSFVE